MKKVLISMLVVSLLMMVGCNDKSTATNDSDNTTQSEQVEDSKKNEDNKRSNEEMYRIYEELLPEVKSYYESLGVQLKEEKDENLSDYSNSTSISYIDYDNNIKGEFSRIFYGLVSNPKGELSFLGGSMYMNIDAEDYKDGNFKFEETPFYELSKIFGAGDLDYTGINEKVNAYFKGNGSDLVQREEGQFSERINLSSGEFVYIININP